MRFAPALWYGGLPLIALIAAALGLWAKHPDIGFVNPFSQRPSPQVASILDDVGPYLCGDPAADACDKDPVNLLFVNVGEQRTSAEAAANVEARLMALDGGWEGRYVVGNTMYFELDGQRTPHQAQLKNYFGTPPDAWHIRLMGSPGCTAGSNAPCFVIGAAHFDTRLGGCNTLVDTSFNYAEARQRISNTFAQEMAVAEVRFRNHNTPHQSQCPAALDHESGVIAVINVGETAEVRWPPTDSSPLVLLDGMLIRDISFGTVYMVQAGQRRAVSHAVFLSCGYGENQIKDVAFFEVWTLPTGEDWPLCRH